MRRARQSVVALDAALRARLVSDVAAKLDTQFLSASGDGITTPRGIFAYPGTQTLAVGGALTLDHLHDAEGLVLAANVDPARVRWVMTSRDFVRLRKVKDTSGKYLVQPDPTEGGAYRLLGLGVSDGTVRSDLASGAQNYAPAPVVGQDGKTYAPARPQSSPPPWPRWWTSRRSP